MNTYQIPVTYTCNGFVEQQGKDFNDAYDKVFNKIEKDLISLDDIVYTGIEYLEVCPICWITEV